MEYDRYQQNSQLFIVGIVSLLLSMALLGFCLYITPAVIWNLHYDIPDFIMDWEERLKAYYQLSAVAGKGVIILIFLLPALLLGLIAFLTSNHIENAIYAERTSPEDQITQVKALRMKDSTKLALKILFLILLALILSQLLGWFIKVTT